MGVFRRRWDWRGQRRFIPTKGLNAYTLTADTGYITVTGQDAGLTVQRTIAAAQASVVVTGQDAGLTVQRTITADVGNVLVNGIAAGLTVQRTIAANTGNVTVTAFDVGLTVQRTLTADTGSVLVNGIDATLTYTPVSTYTLTAATGNVTVTGQTAGLTVQRVLACETAYITVTGQDATLTYAHAGARRKQQKKQKAKTVVLPATVTLWPLVVEDRLLSVTALAVSNPRKPKKSVKVAKAKSATVKLSPVTLSESLTYFAPRVSAEVRFKVGCERVVFNPTKKRLSDLERVVGLIQGDLTDLRDDRIMRQRKMAVMQSDNELVSLGILDPVVNLS